MPAATATFDIVKKDATVDDTLRTIVNAVNQCSRSPFVQQVVQEISKLHDPRTDKQGFIRELFHFVCRNLKYQLDVPGIEEVWTPELTFREGIYDCKKGATFVSAVLAAAGIDPVLKHVYYAGPNGGLESYTHIYTIIPESSMRTGTHTMEFQLQPYITMDTTNDCKFNTEVNHKTATLYFLNGKKMELHMMGAPERQAVQTTVMNTSAFTSTIHDCASKLENDMRCISGIGFHNANGGFDYNAADLALHLALIATPPGLAMRSAYLGLTAMGKLLAKYFKIHLAHRMALAWQQNPAAVKKIWWRLGGSAEATSLKAAIVHGSGISISGPAPMDYDKPWDLISHELTSGIGQAAAATVTGSLAAAAPAIKEFLDLFKNLGIFKEGDTDKADLGPGPPSPPPNSIPPNTIPPAPPVVTPPATNINVKGSMMDFSSPINTIAKAIFLSSASGCVAGINYYILNGFCAAAVIISTIKIYFRK